ncbi:MAG: hypothetical protein Q9207_005078 [Kuettlingeria erythrocarpa]
MADSSDHIPGPPGAICVPMNVDAFVLNKAVCESGLTRIAPITQPDYAGLRPDKSYIRPDILPHVDVVHSQPASTNSRISAIETASEVLPNPSQPQSDAKVDPPLRENRIGVYLHWSLPRMYRAGVMGAEGTSHDENNANKTSSPRFWQVPTRWLVVRRITSSEPELPPGQLEDGWIIESDRLWNIDELGPDVDLETDVSPFVSYTDGDENSPEALNKQASVYIGAKVSAKGWSETGNSVPRTPLTVMNSSNFCFADNMMHNPSVFSMVDNFQHTDANGQKFVLSKVTCDYVVLGWHWDELTDPLYPKLGLQGSLGDRLRDLFLSPGPGLDDEGRLASVAEARTVCHGTIYNVTFDRESKPQPIEAENYARLFTSDIKMEPLGIGTTGLDAILSFLKAHENNSDGVLGSGTGSIARELLSLSELLYATEGDYDGRVKASDVISRQSFATSSGGNAWQYDGKTSVGGKPAQPNTVPDGDTGWSELNALRWVNELQDHLSSAVRMLQEMRWSMFAVWWQYVSDVDNENPARRAWFSTRIIDIRTRAQTLMKIISDPLTGLDTQIETFVRKKTVPDPTIPALVPARSIPQDPFYQRRDPTICIAGMSSAWPTEYMGNVPVRSVINNGNDPEEILPGQMGSIHIPHALWFLGREALTSQDHGSTLGFKTWKGQPWCPLYLEWEAMYFHIPIEKWSVDLMTSPIAGSMPQLRYGVKDRLADDSRSTEDQRLLSGRTILLPQAAVNLKALVKQIIDAPGVTLTPEERTELVANIGRLAFTTAELSGLTTNLITVDEGTHVQPNLGIPGEVEDLPLLAAYLAGRDGGITEQDLRIMGDQTATTPYGTLNKGSTTSHDGFEGVAHGQMLFTKLNIVDKIGQVISAIPPKRPLQKPELSSIDTVYPCLGDQVCPGFVPGTSHLNTVTALTEADPQQPGSYPLCPYVQLTPAINQPTRLNAHFVTPTLATDAAFAGWRVADDWEQPVWGWVIVNFADYGLQFFTAEGQFYVELTPAGSTSTIASPRWQPFNPPSQPSKFVSPQLAQLVRRLSGRDDGVYLHSFFKMITSAIETMPHAPPDYAAYATSIVGKPLALVEVGFSLELAHAPLRSQIVPSPPEPLSPAVPTEPERLLSYKFPIKIGDADRPFDGVVGFFDNTDGVTDWEKLHTYFTSSSSTEEVDPRVPILSENFDTLSPSYTAPDKFTSSADYVAAKAEKLLVKTMLIDPYTPLHVYTPILPITSLQLPAWTVQRALEKMSAFFRLGPVLLTKDVPARYDVSNPLDTETWMEKQRERTIDPATSKIRLPIGGGKKGIWEWLQPYRVEAEGSGSEGRKYNALDVGEEGGVHTFRTCFGTPSFCEGLNSETMLSLSRGSQDCLSRLFALSLPRETC